MKTRKNYILITGGAGFIGSHLAEELSKSSNNFIVIVDDLSTGKLKNIPSRKNVKFIKASVTNTKKLNDLFKKYKFKKVYHLAAIASVAKCLKEPAKSAKVNYLSTVELLNLAAKYKTKRFIFASSAAVYGDSKKKKQKETDAPNPLNPYAVDKYASEKYVINAYKLFGLKTLAFRFFNVYGERQNPDSPYSGVISIFTKKAMEQKSGKKSKIKIFGDGEQSRDFIYVKDLVNAILIAERKTKDFGEIFNIGTGKATTINELIEIIEKVSSLRLDKDFFKERKGDIKHSCADIEKIKSLGFKAKTTLEEGIKKLINQAN